MLKSSAVFWVAMAGLLSCFTAETANAQDPQAGSTDDPVTASKDDPKAASNEDEQRSPDDKARGGLLSDDPEDPGNLLLEIQQRHGQKNSIFPASPLQALHEATDQAKQTFYEETHIKLGLSMTHQFQCLSE